MPPKVRLAVGDIVRIPVGAERWGAAQVVGRVEPLLYYFAGFAGAYRDTEAADLRAVTRGAPSLLALTMDVLVRRGDWAVIGHEQVDYGSVLLPAYKSQRGPRTWALMDYACRIERPATPEEVEAFPFRRDSAPAIFEDAMAGLNGFDRDGGDYAALKPVDRERSSQAIFGVP